ncbi:MAG: tetratricopeptide repeat protein [Acidobacteria bacterium]|nr:tetratricopeptide repeat protein [Acidobacteriota bacterium]
MRSRPLPALVLVGAVLAIYAASLGGSFVWDDAELIVAKAPFFGAEGSAARILSSSDTGLYDEATPYYRPATTLSFLVNYRLFGLEPFWWRLASLLLHAACVLLLFRLAAWLFEDERAGFVAALLLAVHPAAVEAVAFVTARNNLLCAAGLLAALLAVRRRGALALAGALLLFALALSSKEPAVVLPPFLLGLALLARDPRLRATRLVLALFFGVLAAYLGLRALVLGTVAPGLAADGLAARAGLVVGSLFESLRILLLPLHLNASYAPAAVAFSLPKLAATLAGLGGLAWGALARRSPDPVRAGSLWLLLSLLPIANLVPIPSAPVAERYLYVPALGLAVLAAAGWRAAASRWGRTASVLAALLLVALGTRAAVRTTAWFDDRRLFESMVASDPGNASAHYNLGHLRAGSNDLPGAISAWEAALAADPRHAGAHNNLGNAYAMTGRLGPAREHYEIVRELDPAEAMPLYNLARIAELEGRPAEAARLYAEYARADGGSADPRRRALVERARSKASVLGR